jgi:4-amino-4-deoxy-L-arabinose transferase-like glycosyltransferase
MTDAESLTMGVSGSASRSLSHLCGRLGFALVPVKRNRRGADGRSVTVSAASVSLPVARVRSLAAVAPLAALVAISVVVRVLAGLVRSTPYYFPDEYRYAELSRSLAAHGHLLVRGAPAHFLPVLASIVTAPAWLLGTVGESYRAVQVINAVAVSLAAVPVFLMARRLGLGRRSALVAAALALMVPALLYSSYILAEPIAYPLVLAAVAAGLAALDRPSPRRVVVFVVLALLATFARLQFAVLLPCFLVALVALIVRERRFRQTMRDHWRGAVLLLLVTAGLAAAGPARNTGYYPSIFQIGVHPRSLAASLGRNAIVLVFASGFVLVPGAILGLFYSIRRPASRPELAFGLLAGTLTAALIFQASVYGAPTLAQERYTFYVLPLWPLLFLLYARRGWPRRTYQALIALALVACALVTPLTTMALADGELHSPVLYAVVRLRAAMGDNAGTASVVVVLAAALLAVVVACVSAWPRVRSPLALFAAAAFACTTSVGAYSFDQITARQIKNTYAGPNPSWVDASGVTGTRLVLIPGDLKTDALEQLFWNRSVDRVVIMSGARKIDSFAANAGKVARDGTLLVDGRQLSTPVLFDEYGATVQLQDARRVGGGPTSVLYQPNGPVRLRLLAIGSFRNGWLAQRGVFAIWPDAGRATRLAGYLSLRVTTAKHKRPVRLRFRGTSTHVTFRIPAGSTRTLTIPVCSNGPTAITFKATATAALSDHRRVSARTTLPSFVPDAKACTSHHG